MSTQWVDDLGERLPRHGQLVRALADAVVADDRFRWFDVCCSLGAGLGDELSDIDCAVGYAEPISVVEVDSVGHSLITQVGTVVDSLAHRMEGWPDGLRRFAVEYSNGLQLDLVLMPATNMAGLRVREVAIVDKDGNLAGSATSDLWGPPDEPLAREWAMLAWWWVSDIAKYLERNSLFEAAERIALVRDQALKLHATSLGVPYPTFGLTSLLDHEPFELPGNLADTYPVPDDRTTIEHCGQAVAEMLGQCSQRAASRLGFDLSSPWETAARQRLTDAINSKAR